MIHIDLRLAQRIEHLEALNLADYALTQAQRVPASNASVQPIGDGIAAFARADWPVNTAAGIGIGNNAFQSEQLDELEAFYEQFNVEPRVMVCPFTDRDLLQQLGRRGYYIAQFMNVHVRAFKTEDATAHPAQDIEVKVAGEEEADTWALVNVRSGRGEDDIPANDKWLALARTAIARPCVTGFIAWVDGKPAGSAAMCMRDGVATFFSTSTHPDYRRRGVQAALIRARLAHAYEAGCDIAIVTTSPGSDSQRNVQRYGFDVGYTRVTMTR
jgi:GNAT superfamily N-acetyltransferase